MKTAAFVVVTLGYAWVTASAHPFTTLSYCLVAIPSAALVVTYIRIGGLSADLGDVGAYFQRQSGEATLSTVTPWIAVLSAAVVLESVGLLLGGRSTSVPTLSTTVDHLLAYRWERCLLCVAWLSAGALPLFRLSRSLRVRES
jgi:hypothetical protein